MVHFFFIEMVSGRIQRKCSERKENSRKYSFYHLCSTHAVLWVQKKKVMRIPICKSKYILKRVYDYKEQSWGAQNQLHARSTEYTWRGILSKEKSVFSVKHSAISASWKRKKRHYFFSRIWIWSSRNCESSTNAGAFIIVSSAFQDFGKA